LKKLIYAIEKDDLSLSCNLDEELAATDQTPLIINHSVNNVMEATNHRFLAALNKALKKIIAFYAQKETELYDDMDQLLFDYDRLNTLHSHDPLTLSTEPSAIQHSPEHKRHTTALQKRTVDLFVMLSELQSYVTLNHTAFSKILKKYDKITDNALKPYYLANYVDAAFPFKATTRARLDERIQETQHGYVKLVVTADITKESAMEDLKMHLREHVIWERNTVWRDLVGFERKTQTVVLVAEQRGCQWVNGFFLAAALLVFTVLLYLDLFGGQVEQNRCFAILVFTSLLWVGKVSYRRDCATFIDFPIHRSCRSLLQL
jgi:phosphate transporter